MLKRFRGLEEALPYLLVIAGAIGFLASLALMLDRLYLLENPNAVLACDINPFISCGTIMQTPPATAFGFPNPLLGMVGFSVVVTIGMAILAGARLQRWFWLGLQTGVVFGMAFIAWLYYQTLFVIGVLCPYCMVVWVVMVPLFWYVTLYNLRYYRPVSQPWQRAADFLQRHHGDILVAIWALMLGLLLWRFQEQLSLLW